MINSPSFSRGNHHGITRRKLRSASAAKAECQSLGQFRRGNALALLGQALRDRTLLNVSSGVTQIEPASAAESGRAKIEEQRMRKLRPRRRASRPAPLVSSAPGR